MAWWTKHLDETNLELLLQVMLTKDSETIFVTLVFFFFDIVCLFI